MYVRIEKNTQRNQTNTSSLEYYFEIDLKFSHFNFTSFSLFTHIFDSFNCMQLLSLGQFQEFCCWLDAICHEKWNTKNDRFCNRYKHRIYVVTAIILPFFVWILIWHRPPNCDYFWLRTVFSDSCVSIVLMPFNLEWPKLARNVQRGKILNGVSCVIRVDCSPGHFILSVAVLINGKINGQSKSRWCFNHSWFNTRLFYQCVMAALILMRLPIFGCGDVFHANKICAMTGTGH